MTSPILNHTQTFKDHLRGNLKNGITCSGEPGQYVPYSFLLNYWRPQKIHSLLREAKIPGPKPKSIINNYLRVFSILVYTSKLHLLQSLISAQKNDSSLPWSQPPEFLEKADPEYHAFFSNQWKFCPVLLDPDDDLCDTRLHKWSVLPFEERKSVRQPRPSGREATTKIMVVHDDAHAHLPRRAKVPRLVLLKTYEEIYHDEYRLEREANNVFASKEIAPCKGSFHWFDEKNGRIGTLIFEYAEHGTLLDLYLQSHPPYLPEDIKAFWEGITGPAKGLHTIHKQVGYQDGLHHDMKPSNILVFSKEYIDSKLVYDFKIGDFGASYLIPTNVTLEAINRGTTRTYAPPEIYLGDSVKYIVGPTLDMWSIGCIIIEAAVWLTFNERGRQDFRNKRIEEISKLPDLRNLGYGDCFHDGSVALKCVTEYVNLMKLHGRPSDKITPEIVNLATENLLVEEDSRINSLNLHSRLRAILNDKRSSEKLDPTHSLEAYQTKSPSIVGSGMPQQILTGQPLRSEPGEMAPFEMSGDEKISKVSTPGPSSTQPVGPGKLIESNPSSADEAEVYIDQLSSWIKSKKTQWHNDELPGWKLAQGQLKGRDFIILIDNSKSMQKYREEVLRWVSELGYLVKELDPDGGEIRCTSDHTKVVKFKRSTDAKRFVSEKFADGKGAPCNMENALLGVVDSIREPQSTVSSRLSFITRSGSGPKKTTVLVFTDGVWDSSLKNGLIGVDKSIESLIKHMKDSGIGRPNISIQFLRFGSEPVGIKRLEFLDDKLGEKHEFDIVDHKPVTACIWKILNGAVFRGTD